MCCVQVYVELGPVAECRRARAAHAGAHREQRVVQLVERLLRIGCEQHERAARCRHERGRRGRRVLGSEHGARHFEYECVCALCSLMGSRTAQVLYEYDVLCGVALTATAGLPASLSPAIIAAIAAAGAIALLAFLAALGVGIWCYWFKARCCHSIRSAHVHFLHRFNVCRSSLRSASSFLYGRAGERIEPLSAG